MIWILTLAGLLNEWFWGGEVHANDVQTLGDTGV